MYVSSAGTVRLVDLAPAGGHTAPEPFTWGELQALGRGEEVAAAALPCGAAWRVLGEGAPMRPSKLAMHGLPTDVLQLAADMAAGTLPPAVHAYASGEALAAAAAGAEE